MAGDYIQLTIFPDLPIHEQLSQVYVDGLYGPLAQIGTFLHTISSQQELIENGSDDDPRRRAIIDTIFEIYSVTRVYNTLSDKIVREYDEQFWQIDFSDLMDELDFLDDILNERMHLSGRANQFQKFAGEFALNIAKMIIIANSEEAKTKADLSTLKAGPNGISMRKVDYSRETGACMSLYELLRQIIGRPAA